MPGSAGRAAQHQPKQPCAEDHVAGGDGPASARRRAARAFKQAASPLPSFPCLKADGGAPPAAHPAADLALPGSAASERRCRVGLLISPLNYC